MKVLLVLIIAAVLSVAVNAVARKKYGRAIYLDVESVSETACGKPYKSSDLVAVLSPAYFRLRIPVCGRQILVTNLENGKTVTLEIRDKSRDITNTNVGLTKAGLAALGVKFTKKNIQISWYPLAANPGIDSVGGSASASSIAPPSSDTGNATTAAPATSANSTTVASG